MKKLYSFLLIFAMIFTLLGCSSAKNEPLDTSIDSSANSDLNPTDDSIEETTYYPITLTDQAGRQVVINQEPESLISTYYITSSAIIALGLDNKLVAVEDNADARPIYALSAPELLELPGVGSVKEFDVEECASLSPDLVILPMKLLNTVDTLEELGINVLMVNPESQDLLTEMITLIGAATNTTEKADQLLDFLSKKEDDLLTKVSDTEKPRVYLSSNSNFLSTAGDAMYQSDMIHMAGGTNVAAELTDTYWAEIDYEQLLTWDPEYIILASAAKYTVDDILNDPNLANCSAVVNKQVYQIPNDAEAWDSPVPSSILGAYWLANVLHPDLLTDSDFISITDEYYEAFYNFTYSEK